jgi:hypothetical protein
MAICSLAEAFGDQSRNSRETIAQLFPKPGISSQARTIEDRQRLMTNA